MNNIYEIELTGKTVQVRLLGWEPYVPGRVTGPVESCYEAEGGYGEYEVLAVWDEEGEDLPLDSFNELDLEEALFEQVERNAKHDDRDYE